jgi:hypothetical protein
MGKLYTVNKELLTEKPEIRVGDKVYTVDDRMRTFEKMNAALAAEENQGNEFEIIIGFALGDGAAAEITGMDLSFAAIQKIVILIMAAMQDISEDAAEKRFRNGAERG